MNMLAAFLHIACRARLLRRGFCVQDVFAARALFSISRVLVGNALLFFSFLFFSLSVSAQTIRIAAASDLQFVLPDLADQYEKQTGVKLAITYGSSGNFFAQIQNGAPFDLFLSADMEYPCKLIDAGLADSKFVQVYATGVLILWLPPDSPLDPAAGLKTLLDPRIQKIAIANPEHAPYGRAAIEAMRSAGLSDQLKSKLVFGENIAQTAQFVQSGSAQAGLIALSLALSPALNSGKRWIVPTDLYSHIDQGLVILKSSPNKDAARSFLTFFYSLKARATFEHNGYSMPPPGAEESKP
jgi:molybdate transport system substrate-binding protein